MVDYPVCVVLIFLFREGAERQDSKNEPRRTRRPRRLLKTFVMTSFVIFVSFVVELIFGCGRWPCCALYGDLCSSFSKNWRMLYQPILRRSMPELILKRDILGTDILAAEEAQAAEDSVIGAHHFEVLLGPCAGRADPA